MAEKSEVQRAAFGFWCSVAGVLINLTSAGLIFFSASTLGENLGSVLIYPGTALSVIGLVTCTVVLIQRRR